MLLTSIDKRNHVEQMCQLESIQMLFGPKISRLPPYFHSAEPWKWILKNELLSLLNTEKKGEIQKGNWGLEDG